MARFTTTRVRMTIGPTKATKDVPFDDTLAFVAGVMESVPVSTALFGPDDEVSITLTFIGENEQFSRGSAR